jgi:hypothetical protein
MRWPGLRSRREDRAQMGRLGHIAHSVTSSCSSSGGIPLAASASSMSTNRFSSTNCRGDRLTAIEMPHRLATTFLMIVSESRTTSRFNWLFSIVRESSACFIWPSRSPSLKVSDHLCWGASSCIVRSFGLKQVAITLRANTFAVNLVNLLVQIPRHYVGRFIAVR